MNNNNIKSLLISIRETIKKGIDGEFSVIEIRNEYIKLYTIYDNIIKLQNINPVGSFLKGIFYNHNIKNFSKITALYISKNDTADQICYFGDVQLGNIINKFINEKKSAGVLPFLKPEKIIIDDNNNLTYLLYLQTIECADDVQLISATITSSHFFNEEQFLFLNKVICLIYKKMLHISSGGFIDFFDIISKKIIEYINTEGTTSVQLFVFQSLKEIFQDSAISVYNDISRNIHNTLKKYFSRNSKIFVLSLTQYIVLSQEEVSHENVKKKNSKINFTYNELLIPYETILIETKDFQSIYKFWDEVFIINNYISAGDIRL